MPSLKHNFKLLNCVILLAVIQGCYNFSFGQATFLFKGQICHQHLGPQKRMKLLVNQYSVFTDDAGVFTIALPKTVLHVKITLVNTNYQIFYPIGGSVPIPRDAKHIPQIIVGNTTENNYLQQYLELYRRKKQESGKTEEDSIMISKKMDSIQKVLTRMHFTETELRAAEKLSDGKEHFYPDLSADLIDFRNKAFDLRSAFKYTSQYAFDNEQSLEVLIEAVKNYNASFNKFDRQHSNYEKAVAEYWRDDNLSNAFNELANFVINEVHAQKIYPMQAVILQIRQYFQGKKKNKLLRKSIEQNINQHVTGLDKILPELEMKTNVVLRNLK